jgi:hypothetical protein
MTLEEIRKARRESENRIVAFLQSEFHAMQKQTGITPQGLSVEIVNHYHGQKPIGFLVSGCRIDLGQV